jgi:putative phage-type endonuclease
VQLYKGTNAIIVADIDPERFSEQRREGIGGTDISAIAGINPWSSALTVYYDKTGDLPSIQPTERMQWGTLLEPIIVQQCAERLNLTLDECPHILAHPEVSYFRASPDRIIIDPERGNGILEVKNIGHWAAQDVRSGLSEIAIPDHYILQLQWYLHVTGLQWGVFGALLEGNELVTEEVKRDDSLIADLVSIAHDFWKCVTDRTPPAADGSESTTNTLKQMFPIDEELPPVILTPEFLPMFAERAVLKERAKETKSRLDEIENQIKAAIGSAAAAACGQYEVTYKQQTRKETIQKASTFRVLKVKGE